MPDAEPDADLRAVLQKVEADLVELRRLATQLHMTSHELVNVLQAPIGQLDLAVIRVRRALDNFYEAHPDLL